jgi:hypothetical protein
MRLRYLARWTVYIQQQTFPTSSLRTGRAPQSCLGFTRPGAARPGCAAQHLYVGARLARAQRGAVGYVGDRLLIQRIPHVHFVFGEDCRQRQRLEMVAQQNLRIIVLSFTHAAAS